MLKNPPIPHMPIHVTRPVCEQLEVQDVSLYTNPAELAAMLDETERREEFADGGVIFVSKAVGFRSDRLDQPQCEPVQATNYAEVLRRAHPRRTPVVPVQAPKDGPITEEALARNAAESLLRPARSRNALVRGCSVVLGFMGVLSEVVAIDSYATETQHAVTPLSLTGGLVLLAAGVPTFVHTWKRQRQLDRAEQRAAQHHLIKVIPNSPTSAPSGA